jgi:hypothetical protein
VAADEVEPCEFEDDGLVERGLEVEVEGFERLALLEAAALDAAVDALLDRSKPARDPRAAAFTIWPTFLRNSKRIPGEAGARHPESSGAGGSAALWPLGAASSTRQRLLAPPRERTPRPTRRLPSTRRRPGVNRFRHSVHRGCFAMCTSVTDAWPCKLDRFAAPPATEVGQQSAPATAAAPGWVTNAPRDGSVPDRR